MQLPLNKTIKFTKHMLKLEEIIVGLEQPLRLYATIFDYDQNTIRAEVTISYRYSYLYETILKTISQNLGELLQRVGKKYQGKRIKLEIISAASNESISRSFTDEYMNQFIDKHSGIISSISYNHVRQGEKFAIATEKTDMFNIFLENLHEHESQEFSITQQNEEKYTTVRLSHDRTIKDAFKSLAIRLRAQTNPKLRELTLNISHLPETGNDQNFKKNFSQILETIDTLILLNTNFEKESPSSFETLFQLMDELKDKCKLHNLVITAERLFLCPTEYAKLASNLERFTDVTLEGVFHKTPKLLSVNLISETNLDFILYFLARQKYDKDLTLEITGFDSKVNPFYCIHDLCQKLGVHENYAITLNLDGSEWKHDDQVPRQLIDDIFSFKNVVALKMCNIAWNENSADDLFKIFYNPQNIRSLNLDGGTFNSQDITRHFNVVLFNIVQIAKLDALSLNKTNLTNDQLFSLAEAALDSGITTLSLQGTQNITEENIKQLTKGIKNNARKTNQLISVDFGGSTFTDDAIVYLEQTLPAIHKICPFNLRIQEKYQTDAIRAFILAATLENLHRLASKDSFQDPSSPASLVLPQSASETINNYLDRIKDEEKKQLKDVDQSRAELVNILIDFYAQKLLLYDSFYSQALSQVSQMKSGDLKTSMYINILAALKFDIRHISFDASDYILRLADIIDSNKVKENLYADILDILKENNPYTKLDPEKILTYIYKDKNVSDLAVIRRCEKLLVTCLKQKIPRECREFTPGLFKPSVSLNLVKNLAELLGFLSALKISNEKLFNEKKLQQMLDTVKELVDFTPMMQPFASDGFLDCAAKSTQQVQDTPHCEPQSSLIPKPADSHDAFFEIPRRKKSGGIEMRPISSFTATSLNPAVTSDEQQQHDDSYKISGQESSDGIEMESVSSSTPTSLNPAVTSGEQQ